MEVASSPSVGPSESPLDYSFGFDNANFSNKILVLEIIDDPETETEPDPDDKALDNAFERPPRVKTIHINSLVLAARSPFFRKLFSNGMKESKERHVTIRIEALEEISFMDLLTYIYSSSLPTTMFALLDLLEIADKFEPLIDAAKQFLVAYFKDLDRLKKEALNLPLAGIQAVLSNDDLRVTSECVVYDLVLMWARRHYPDLEERREMMKTHLLHLIRFPLMTTSKLVEEVLPCSDIDPELASKIVIRALHFKADTPHQQRCQAAEESNVASRQFVKRAYTFRPVNVVEFELPHQQCKVYLDLKWEEETHIFSGGDIRSETFHLGGQQLVLTGQCFLDKQTDVQYCWLSLVMQVAGSASYTVDYDIALRTKPIGGVCELE